MRTWLGIACWAVVAASSVACSGGESETNGGDPPGQLAQTVECGERLSLDQLSGVSSGLGPHTSMARLSYVGPGVVELSTDQELVVAYGPDGSELQSRRADVTGASAAPLPVLPEGAQVWLSVTEVSRNLEGLTEGVAIAVKTDEQGPLLFGQASGTTTAGLPSAERVEQSSCTVHENPICPGDSSSYVTYMAAELQGDDPVVIDDSQTGTVQLAGVAYDAVVTARADIARCGVNDYAPPPVTFELRARNLDALITALTMR